MTIVTHMHTARTGMGNMGGKLPHIQIYMYICIYICMYL